MAFYVHELLDELSWPYVTPADLLSCDQFVISMGAGEIPVTAESFGDSRIILIYLHFGIVADVSKRSEVTSLLCRINNEIPIGNWCIHEGTGKIWFRITMHGCTENDCDLLDRCVELARNVFADWQKPISVVLTSDVDAEGAFMIKLLIDMENPEQTVRSLSGKYKP
jgi:hypothetical protein